MSPIVRALFFSRWMVEPPATCDGCMAKLLRSIFRRWRDALFEGPFGQSPGRTKLRSQLQHAVQFHRSLMQWFHVQPLALSRTQGPTRPLPPSLPSQEVVVVTDADVPPLFVSELLAGGLGRDGFEIAFPWRAWCK